MNRHVDLAGLSPESVRFVESLVQSMRSEDSERSWSQRDPDGWAAALREWIRSHPQREIAIDDSRETIYAGRGE
jgi:hypothetical protein